MTLWKDTDCALYGSDENLANLFSTLQSVWSAGTHAERGASLLALCQLKSNSYEKDIISRIVGGIICRMHE